MDLRLLICQIIISLVLATLIYGAEPTNSTSATNLASNEARKPTHCIATPQNLSFCSSKLGWAPTMAIPNLIGHENENELTLMLNDLLIADLASISCKASLNLKLLMCSVMAPVCLDVVVPPCRHLCTSVKNSCEPAMRRQGIEWPKFLDCRRFPSGADGCLRRQPMLDTNAASLINLTDAMTTLEAAQEQNSANVYSTSSRKRKGHKGKGGRRTSSTTSTTTTATPSSSNMPSTPNEETDDENLVTSAPVSQTIPVVTPTTGLDLSTTTTMTSTTSTTTTTTTPSPSTTATFAPTSTAEPATRQPDPSSIPISVSDNLVQVLCATSPEWLIKTKLSDAQLLSAASKRKLKVRSFRQIFGSLPNHDSSSGSSNARQLRNNKAGNSTASPSSLYLTITNTTLFTAAMGPNIYTQPLSDALPKSGQIEVPSGSKSVRYYLIAGSGSPGASGKVSASMLVVWPTNRISTTAADSQGSQSIITAYKDLKRRGAQVCSSLDNTGSTKPSSNKTEDISGSPATMTVADSTPTSPSPLMLPPSMESNQTQRARKNKRKRIQPSSD